MNQSSIYSKRLFKRHSNRRPGEIVDSRSGAHTGKYMIRFKRKDEWQNKTDDKYQIFSSALGLGDYSDHVDLSTVFTSKAMRSCLWL
jgi:hypothetical protein